MGEMGLSLARYNGRQSDLLCDSERPEVGGRARISADTRGEERCSGRAFKERAERTKDSSGGRKRQELSPPRRSTAATLLPCLKINKCQTSTSLERTARATDEEGTTQGGGK